MRGAVDDVGATTFAGMLQVSVEGAVEEGLEEMFQAAAAGGLGGFQRADFGHALGEVRLQRHIDEIPPLVARAL